MTHPIETNEAAFAADVSASGITLVDFWAAWCGPCRAFAPVFEASAAKHPDIRHLKVDVDANPALAAAHGVQSIPTILVLRDGLVLGSVAGALPAPKLEDLIERARGVDMDEVHRQQ